MFSKINGTYGYRELINTSVPFHNADSYENFKQRILVQPISWKYHRNQIQYRYNNAGHRSEDLHVTNEKYILFTGCSITEGIGLANEELFANNVASNFGMLSYNLGLGGSGPDLMSLNLSLWLQQHNKPQAVVVQWPEPNRRLLVHNHADANALGPWVLDAPVLKGYAYEHELREEIPKFKSLIMSDAVQHYSDVIRATVTTMLKLAKIPYVELFIKDYNNLVSTHEETLPTVLYADAPDDFARDLSHPGTQWHYYVANRITSKLSEQFTKNS